MQQQSCKRNTASVTASLPARQTPPFLQFTLPKRHRKSCIVPPALPQVQTYQPNLAAQRTAELAWWQATGGDFLRHSPTV